MKKAGYPMKTAMKVLALVCVLLALLGAYTVLSSSGISSQRGVEWGDIRQQTRDSLQLPDGAQAISYWMRSGLSGQVSFECTLTEDRFRDYLKRLGAETQPIVGQYTLHRPFEAHPEKVFVEGEYYSKRQGNGGGISLVYVKKDHRLFVEHSAR